MVKVHHSARKPRILATWMPMDTNHLPKQHPHPKGTWTPWGYWSPSRSVFAATPLKPKTAWDTNADHFCCQHQLLPLLGNNFGTCIRLASGREVFLNILSWMSFLCATKYGCGQLSWIPVMSQFLASGASVKHPLFLLCILHILCVQVPWIKTCWQTGKHKPVWYYQATTWHEMIITWRRITDI